MKSSRPLFDEYLMVDWCAKCDANPASGADTTWVAHGDREGDAIEVINTRTRPAAFQLVLAKLLAAVHAGRRALVGFDFAYGYPAGLSRVLWNLLEEGHWLKILVRSQ